jgi:hypothetical protein
VSQPGATVALAALARRAFPEWGVSLEALVLAMIGVNEVAGAISFRRALDAVGDSKEDTHDAAQSVGDRDLVTLGGGGV